MYRMFENIAIHLFQILKKYYLNIISKLKKYIRELKIFSDKIK